MDEKTMKQQFAGDAGNVKTDQECAEVACNTAIGAGVGFGPDLRCQLERERDQHLRDAENIQVLMDMLPAKIPARASWAIQSLMFRVR